MLPINAQQNVFEFVGQMIFCRPKQQSASWKVDECGADLMFDAAEILGQVKTSQS